MAGGHIVADGVVWGEEDREESDGCEGRDGPRSLLDFVDLEEPEKETLWPVPEAALVSFGLDQLNFFSSRAGLRGESGDSGESIMGSAQEPGDRCRVLAIKGRKIEMNKGRSSVSARMILIEWNVKARNSEDASGVSKYDMCERQCGKLQGRHPHRRP